jgi:hypothetical protein
MKFNLSNPPFFFFLCAVARSPALLFELATLFQSQLNSHRISTGTTMMISLSLIHKSNGSNERTNDNIVTLHDTELLPILLSRIALPTPPTDSLLAYILDVVSIVVRSIFSHAPICAIRCRCRCFTRFVWFRFGCLSQIARCERARRRATLHGRARIVEFGRRKSYCLPTTRRRPPPPPPPKVGYKRLRLRLSGMDED